MSWTDFSNSKREEHWEVFYPEWYFLSYLSAEILLEIKLSFYVLKFMSKKVKPFNCFLFFINLKPVGKTTIISNYCFA